MSRFAEGKNVVAHPFDKNRFLERRNNLLIMIDRNIHKRLRIFCKKNFQFLETIYKEIQMKLGKCINEY